MTYNVFSTVLISVGLFLLFILPLYLWHRYLQGKTDTKRAVDYKNSLDIIHMTRSVDEPCDIAECFDELKKNMNDMGLELNMNMKGYMT